jgi:hypothetical protein
MEPNTSYYITLYSTFEGRETCLTGFLQERIYVLSMGFVYNLFLLN